MSLVVKIGATLTGGTDVTLTSAGATVSGKASFVTPSSTQLTPRTVDFSISPAQPSKTDPGVARSGLKISFANRVEQEGCCGVQAGNIIVDVGVRWPLSQPETVVDDVLSYLRGLVYTSAFADAIKKGILPQ